MLERTPPRDNLDGQSKVVETSGRFSAVTKGHRGPRSFPRREYIKMIRIEEAEQLQKCRTVIGSMKSATSRQRNISMDVKTSLKKLVEAIDVIDHCRANGLKMNKKAQKHPI